MLPLWRHHFDTLQVRERETAQPEYQKAEEAMRRLERRIYAGVPREDVTVDTEVEGGGHVTVLLDGADVGADPTFTLKPRPGDETSMSIGLIGATGESCVVRIRTVDGASDVDLLLCQISDPAPVHLYRFIVTPPGALASMERAAPRGIRLPEPAEDAVTVTRAAKKRAKRKSAAKRGRKSSSRRGR